MKNEYDALNKAWMDLDGLDDAPLSSAELGSLKKRLGREGMPFPTRAPGRGMLALGLAAVLTAGGQKATLYLKNLFAYPTETDRYHDEDAQVPGSLEFTFRLPQSEAGTLLFESKEGLDLGLAAPLGRLWLSPLCLELELTGQADPSRSLLDGIELTLLFEDGTHRQVVGEGVSGEDSAKLYGAESRILCSFAQLVDTDTLSGVELNGQIFSLEGT